jgi:hypothetical protein
MEEILKYTKVNVCIKDEDEKILFEDHNLFVDSGRVFIADILRGAISFNPIYFVCDLGTGTTTPVASDTDLVTYTSPLSIQINTPSYPIALLGTATGIHLQFIFNNTGFGGDQTIRELGLFYRANSNDFPRRGTPVSLDTMLARLKTTLNSIVVGNTRTITIDWKIIF